MRDLHSSVNKSNLINCLDFWGKASMNAEDFSFNNSSNSKIIKDLGAVFPRICISVFSNSFVVETVDSGDLSSFMISSKKGDMCWVFQFQAQQKLESLNRIESSINKITHENVSCIGDLTSFLEQL